MVNTKKSSSKPRFRPPDWEKKLHHVVPVSWQKKFSAPAHPGCPFYKCIANGRHSGPVPGTKMAVKYGNIFFDKKGFPVDELENRLGQEELNLIPVLDRVLSTVGSNGLSGRALVGLPCAGDGPWHVVVQHDSACRPASGKL